MRRKRNPLSLKKVFRGFWAGPAVEAEGDTMAEILIFDVIGDDFFGEGISGLSVREALDELEGADVRVRINSPGGDVFEGIAIHNALREYPGNVIVVVDALAASAAAIIAMAGDEIIMAENATFMIHEPWTFAIGDAKELRAQAGILETINMGLIKTFARRSGLPEAEIEALLKAETWLSADETVDMGFADEVREAGASPRNKFDLSQFKKPKSRASNEVDKFLSSLPADPTSPTSPTPTPEPDPPVVTLDLTTDKGAEARTKAAVSRAAAYSRIALLDNPPQE